MGKRKEGKPRREAGFLVERIGLPPIHGRDDCLMSIKLCLYDFGMGSIQNGDPMLLAHYLSLMIERKGFPKNRQDGLRVVVGSDAIDGQDLAFDTLMDQHQLAARLAPVFVPAWLHGQPDGLHRRLAGG